MSRAKAPVSSSQNKAKPTPTNWKDRLSPEDYEDLRATF